MSGRYRTLVIGKEEEGRTVGEILRSVLGMSASRIRSVKFDAAGLLLDGERVRTSAAVRAGQSLQILLTDSENKPDKLLPFDMPLHILYEDEDLIALAKPAGIVMHPSQGHPYDTLANGVRAYFDRADAEARVHCIGRLDKDTSGAVLFAKNAEAARLLERPGAVKKQYLAFCEGELEGDGWQVIDRPMEGCRREDGMLVMTEGGRPAVTRYRVRRCAEGMTALDVEIETGRTHQIRYHFASLGHPLVGDALYGHGSALIGRTALHAALLTFHTPFTHRTIAVEAPVPEDMGRLALL